MSYADITLNDRSRVKRFVQERRLADALKLFPAGLVESGATVVDFGAGNGELSIRLSRRYPASLVVCYEPGDLLQEAKERVGGKPGISVVENSSEICSESVDVVYCLEVFEHLPDVERKKAIDEIYRILKYGGRAIVGVPVEIGLPALPKGLFRLARRWGEFDATIGNILKSTLGIRYGTRPVIEIKGGLHYHPHHVGFDYRRLIGEVSLQFQMEGRQCSPFAFFGPLLNSEIYFIVSKVPRR